MVMADTIRVQSIIVIPSDDGIIVKRFTNTKTLIEFDLKVFFCKKPHEYNALKVFRLRLSTPRAEQQLQRLCTTNLLDYFVVVSNTFGQLDMKSNGSDRHCLESFGVCLDHVNQLWHFLAKEEQLVVTPVKVGAFINTAIYDDDLKVKDIFTTTILHRCGFKVVA